MKTVIVPKIVLQDFPFRLNGVKTLFCQIVINEDFIAG